jgi:D-arabinose 1-dehydrogenase-like Zn-dependent alcohol dehydrogenase
MDRRGALCRLAGAAEILSEPKTIITNKRGRILIRRATAVHIATAGSRAAFETMVRAMELHAVRPAISGDFPVEQIAAAFECLQQGGHFGKVVVRF